MKWHKFFIIVILILSGSLHLFGKVVTNSKTVDMMQFKLTIKVEYEEKREEVAPYYLEKAAVYLPALEKYLDIPFPRQDVKILCDENPGHAYMYSWGIKLVDRHLNYKMPGVMFHEFAHFYFRGWRENAWLVEGINSFIPIALCESGFLTKEECEYHEVKKIWGFKDMGTKKDQPVINDFRKMNWHFFYTKTFKIQYLIFKELGSKKYRSFVQDVANEMDWIFSYLNTKTEKFLRKQKNMNWTYFLTGWVYSGDYTVFTIESFKDYNNNGKIDVLDFYDNNPGGMPIHYKQKKVLFFWVDEA